MLYMISAVHSYRSWLFRWVICNFHNCYRNMHRTLFSELVYIRSVRKFVRFFGQIKYHFFIYKLELILNDVCTLFSITFSQLIGRLKMLLYPMMQGLQEGCGKTFQANSSNFFFSVSTVKGRPDCSEFLTDRICIYIYIYIYLKIFAVSVLKLNIICHTCWYFI